MWKLNNTHLNKQWVTEEIKRKILVPWDKNENTLYQNLVVLFSHAVISDSVTPWTAARQPSLSFTISRNLLKLMSIESVIPSNHLILCRPLLLLPSVFPNESALRIRWPKYWSFSINEYSGLISFRIDWFDLLAVQGTLKSLLQHHSLFLGSSLFLVSFHEN